MMKIRDGLELLCSLLFAACGTLRQSPPLAAEFSVHKVFGDHMVLQRDREIQISGTCPPGQAVSVSLAGATRLATGRENGEWVVELPSMPAGGPHVISVAGAGDRKVEFKDVLIGEVWLCSGQSNMAMPLWSERPFWRSEKGDVEAASANFPRIRLYNENLCASLAPEGPVPESRGQGWTPCNPESAAAFSAAGYYFGKQLHLDLDVPIGLINSSWGGSPIQSWISRDGFQRHKRQNELDQIDSLNQSRTEEIQAEKRRQIENWEASFLRQNPEKSAIAKRYRQADYDDSGWDKAVVPAPVTLNCPGVFWYRHLLEIPSGWGQYELELGLGAIDEADEAWFNGEQIGVTGTNEPEYWKKERIYKIPAGLLRPGKNCIAVRVINFEGAVGMEGPAPALYLRPYGDENTRISLAGEWKHQVEFKAEPGRYPARPRFAPERTSHAFPATLFNSMIAPWCCYAIRGILWYQGESNAWEYSDYYQLQKILLADWRRQWNNPELAFVLTQLAAFHKHDPANPLKEDFWEMLPPEENSWSWIREAQRAMLREPCTGMAVSIDIGNHSDIHPADKKTLGFRLAQEGKRICCGFQGVSAGPLYRKMKKEGNRIRLYFDNIGSGLVAKGDGAALHSFAVAGEDGRYYWADAQIDGATVLVSADAVQEPLRVRYAWAMYPGNANLYNAEGFPASPFQTDIPDWLR